MGEEKIDDLSYLADIRKVIELKSGSGFIDDEAGRSLNKLYKNETMKKKIAKARERMISKKNAEREADDAPAATEGAQKPARQPPVPRQSDERGIQPAGPEIEVSAVGVQSLAEGRVERGRWGRRACLAAV